MAQQDDNTNEQHYTQLTLEERYKIEAYMEASLSFREMGRRLGRHHSTISKEVKRGTVPQIRRQTTSSGKTYEYQYEVYSAQAGQASYETAHKECGRRPKWLDLSDFMNWADTQMLVNKWSPEVVLANAKDENLFPEIDLPSVSTLYIWIDNGLMKTKNIDLPEKPLTNPERKSSFLGHKLDPRAQSR